MTIGPEPITSTWLRSVATSALAFLPCHQVDELVEQVLRIVRAGRGLRVVLNRKCSPVERV